MKAKSEKLDFEKIWKLFQETDKKFQETAKQFEETKQLLKEESLKTEKN